MYARNIKLSKAIDNVCLIDELKRSRLFIIGIVQWFIKEEKPHSANK